jgi:hypothetical protein
MQQPSPPAFLVLLKRTKRHDIALEPGITPSEILLSYQAVTPEKGMP